ncbi:PREDICTED: spindle and kinetochore-associated protein 1 isoform X2 [Chrysochloris asiatica]|uniref:SKA complex subunit 1 n=1 Tax=Chrysochloris asiatica TaxID=185453 RepID=A0A9B0TC56_CHRAS|nr:PREDICTED: spindle and kinetochore-associated protein 1 isoform X2 [Chrysochloris asiatica]
MASSDLEQLCTYINEKIGNIKNTLSIRNGGQEPALKTILNKIGNEIIVVNELLNKLELEIEYHEQTSNSLKELCESLEEDYKDVQHLKENIPPHLPQIAVTKSLYMKSRLTYCQINDVIKEINKAVASKYKIVHQPKKSMSSVVRNLYHRFIEEETKDTKGHYFVVEADIKEFTALKIDKRFHVILNILRHCKRLSEVRGGRLTRYVIT